LTNRAPAPRRPVTFIYAWWSVATLAVAGYGIATRAWGLSVAAFVVYGAEAAGAIVWTTLKQQRVPNSMLGRVSSIDWCISTALLPLSYAITVPVTALLGARTTLVLAGAIGAAVTLGFLFLPGMRTGHAPSSAVSVGAPDHGALPSATERPEAGRDPSGADPEAARRR